MKVLYILLVMLVVGLCGPPALADEWNYTYENSANINTALGGAGVIPDTLSAVNGFMIDNTIDNGANTATIDSAQEVAVAGTDEVGFANTCHLITTNTYDGPDNYVACLKEAPLGERMEIEIGAAFAAMNTTN